MRALFFVVGCLVALLSSLALDSDDLAVVGTVDGFVHGIDPNSNVLWSVSTGGALLSSSKSIRGNEADLPYSIIPSVDGSLLIHDNNGMRNTSIKTQLIFEKMPFFSSDGKLIFSGNKKIKLIRLNPRTGEVLQEISESDSPIPLGKGDIPHVWLSRVDYTLRIFDSEHGSEQFHILFSEVKLVDQNLISGRKYLLTGNLMGNLPVSLAEDPAPGFSRSIVSSSNGDTLVSLAPADDNQHIGSILKSNIKLINLKSPVASAYLLSGTQEQLSAHPIPVSYHPGEDGVKSGEYVDILANEAGGLYAIRINPGSILDKKIDSDEISMFLPGSLEQGQPRKNSFHLRSRRTPLQRTYSVAVSRVKSGQQQPYSKPLKERFSEDSNSRAVAIKSNETSLSTSHCLAFPSTFHDTQEIEIAASEALTLAQDSFPLCLLGQHPLLTDAPVDQFHTVIFNEQALAEPQRPANLDLPPTNPSVRPKLIPKHWSFVFLFLMVLVIIYQVYLNFFSKKEDDATHPIQVPDKVPPFISESTQPQANRSTKVGSLEISEKILGIGSHGTLVYKGYFDGRPVAIKRMLSQFSTIAEREMNLLMKSDGHPNVVRYFFKEEKGEFIYIALQLCQMSLSEFIVKASKLPLPDSKREIVDAVSGALLQISKGVDHLHSQRIVHRDLKPQNILCAVSDERIDSVGGDLGLQRLSEFTLKISDMGVSKQLSADELSVSHSITTFNGRHHDTEDLKRDALDEAHVGTVGWQAPEIIRLKHQSKMKSHFYPQFDLSNPSKKKTQAVDIFSLGCIFHFLLVPGVHPFGKTFERELNILNGTPDLTQIQDLPLAYDIIRRMVDSDPAKRPNAHQVSHHPFFWSPQMKLDFLSSLSDRLEHESSDSKMILSIESNAVRVIGISWDSRLEPRLLEDSGKYRKYDKSSVRDLLRLIRNKRHHFHELPSDLRSQLSPMPCAFLTYFEAAFPNLIAHCVQVVYSDYHFCSESCGDSVISHSAKSLHALYSRGQEAIPTSPTATLHSGLPIKSEAGQPHLPPSVSAECPPSATLDSSSSTDTEHNVIVWRDSSFSANFKCRGWLRSSNAWASAPIKAKQRPSHITKSLNDPKYRSRLCAHW